MTGLMLLMLLFALLNAEPAMPISNEAVLTFQTAIHWDRGNWRVCHEPECQKPTPKTVLLKPVPITPDNHRSPEIPHSVKE